MSFICASLGNIPLCHSTVVAEYRKHHSNVSHNSELMLTMTLSVLRRQARYIRGDARRLFAFLEGLRTWRRQYGRQLASELASSFSTLQVRHLRRKLLLLLNHYPQGLILLVLLSDHAGPAQAQGRGLPSSRDRRNATVTKGAGMVKCIEGKLAGADRLVTQ